LANSECPTTGKPLTGSPAWVGHRTLDSTVPPAIPPAAAAPESEQPPKRFLGGRSITLVAAVVLGVALCVSVGFDIAGRSSAAKQEKHLNSELTSAKKNLSAARSDRDEANAQRDSAESEAATVQSQLDSSQDQLSTAQSDLQDMTSQRDECAQTIHDALTAMGDYAVDVVQGTESLDGTSAGQSINSYVIANCPAYAQTGAARPIAGVTH
jgi:uncharacterized protein HemX